MKEDKMLTVPVAIISFITNSSHLNYGAMLHGYAFQQYLLKTFNLKSVIIDYFPKALKGENLKYPILNKRQGGTIIIEGLRKINWILGFRENILKWKKFDRFKRKHLKTTSVQYNYESLQSLEEGDELNCELFVCEADVIWKITDINSIDENFFLNFPKAKDKIKVAYAPTIGSKSLEGDLLHQFKHLTNDFLAISARESIGACKLGKYLKREVDYVLDPTLLLDAKDYNNLAKEPPITGNYLLIYTCTVNDREMVKMAKKYGRQHNLKVIEIGNYAVNRFITPHKVVVNAGIEGWLGYFKNAKMIITNSFHGLCFSVLYKKDFFVFERNKTDYRMPDIANSLGVTDRLIPSDSRTFPADSKPIVYEEVYKRLNKLRVQSMEFIEKNIVEKLC